MQEPKLKPHRLWWTLFRTKFNRTRATLPLHLRGNIQFKIETSASEADWFYLALNGNRTHAADGLATKVDVLVTSTPEKLARLMFQKSTPQGALLVAGDVALFRSVLAHMNQAPNPQSLLHVRGAR